MLSTVKAIREHRNYAQPKIHTAVMKTLFLLSREYDLGGIKPYSFYPYKYGPYSSIAFQDLTHRMSQYGCLDGCEGLTQKGELAVGTLSPSVLSAVAQCASRFANDQQLVDYVYGTYPAYAIRSQLEPVSRPKAGPALFTIGYEGRDIDAFIDILLQNGVELLADVRHNPFSMNFSFVKSKLAAHLSQAGIEYAHFPELGIAGEKRKGLKTPEDYARLFGDYERNTLREAEDALSALAGLGRTKRAALMCFEHEEKNCHRGVIAEALRRSGTEVAPL